jgi:hypothetical protein
MRDDDVMSVTSREVADILSKAAPMAPLSDEEEEQYVNEEADDCEESYYSNNEDGNETDHYEDDVTSRQSDVRHRLSIDDNLRNVAYKGGDDQLAHWQQVGPMTTAVNRAMSLDTMTVGAASLGRQHLAASSNMSNGGGLQWQQRQQQQPGRGGDAAPQSRTMVGNGADSLADNFRRMDNRLTVPPANLFQLVRSCRLLAVRLERRRRSDTDDERRQRNSPLPFQVRVIVDVLYSIVNE